MNKVIKLKDEKFESVYKEFERWRTINKGKKSRIPSHLWGLAIDLCGSHPIGRVHRILKLSYTGLKKKVKEERGVPTLKGSEISSFVELKVPGDVSSSGLFNIGPCVEIYRRDGSRMKISPGSNNSFNFIEICQVFLKS